MMSNTTGSNKVHLAEQISAMVDGELPDAQWQAALSLMQSDTQAMQTWHAYHVVGEVMRGEPVAPANADLAFLARLQEQLALEPAQAALPAVLPTRLSPDFSTAPVRNAAANDPAFRWKAVAAVSSMALVLVLAMGSRFGHDDPAAIADAKSNAPSVVTGPMVTVAQSGGEELGSVQMIRDPALDAMLAAHQQMGGMSALQGPSGFLRNATYSEPTR